MKTRSALGALVLILAFPASSSFARESLLANGDAEQGAVGQPPPHWGPRGYKGSSYPTDFPLETSSGGRNGSKAISFECPRDYTWTLIQQYIPVELDYSKRVVWSAWLRSDKPLPKVGFHLHLTPAGQKGGGNTRSHVAVGAEWRRCEIDLDLALVTTGEARGHRLRPIVQLMSPGRIEMDDASLVMVDSEITPEQKAKLDIARKILPPDAITVNSPIGITGGIVARDDGALLAFTPDFGVRTSTDGGKIWSPRSNLAIGDPFDKITGAIRMSNGTIGIHTESWNKPMYFWESDDGARTWSTRIQIGPKGAPLHGNVMIETSVRGKVKDPVGWRKKTRGKDGRYNQPDSKSTFIRVPTPPAPNHAAALTLHGTDGWIYAETRIEPDRTLRAGDEYVFRLTVKAEKKAAFDLYIEAWNPKAKGGSRGRKRFEAGSDWQEYEMKLTASEAAQGLESFRVVVQLYTPGVELLFDNARVDRVLPHRDSKPLALKNPSFESAAVGRLLIPVRQGYAFSGGAPREDYMAGGIDVRGNRILIEHHGQLAEMVITFVHYSDDGGNSWRRSHPIFIWRDDGYNGIGMADEPSIAELKDGRLIMFIRNPLGRIYQTTSADGGRTWDYPTAADLPSSLSPCSLKRVPENEYTLKTGRAGDLVVVWNNVSHDEIKRGFRRGRLSVAVSTDDAKTWKHIKTIDTAGLPAIKGVARLSPPGMVRAERDLGRLPLPIGFVHYPDITFLDDKVLIKYAKSFKNPSVGMGTPMHIIPIDWLYKD